VSKLGRTGGVHEAANTNAIFVNTHFWKHPQNDPSKRGHLKGVSRTPHFWCLKIPPKKGGIFWTPKKGFWRCYQNWVVRTWHSWQTVVYTQKYQLPGVGTFGCHCEGRQTLSHFWYFRGLLILGIFSPQNVQAPKGQTGTYDTPQVSPRGGECDRQCMPRSERLQFSRAQLGWIRKLRQFPRSIP
jgi:hypothetical protein